MLTRDQYLVGLKTLFVSLGKEAVMKQLAVSIPILSNPFTAKIIEMILKTAVDSLEVGAFFYFIDTRVGDQKREFENAIYEFINADPSKKSEAENNAKIAFKNFVRFVS